MCYRHITRTPSIALALLLAVTGCSGGDDDDGTDDPAPAAACVDVVSQALRPELPDGFSIEDRRPLDDGSCTVVARDGTGAVIAVYRQPRPPPTYLEIPLSGSTSSTIEDDGTEVVLDDFYGDGSRVTAIVVTDEGVFTRVTAIGKNVESLAGWPTTTATMPGTPEPGPRGRAPLTLEETEALARAI